jgi:hypothetical protein
MRPCPRCTRDIQGDASFCPSCGALVGAPPPAIPKRKMRWLHALLAFVALAVAPPLDELLHRSAVLVAFAVVCALALLVAIFAGRRDGAHCLIRPFGNHPAWTTYVAVLLLLAAIPKSARRADRSSAATPEPTAATASSSIPTQTAQEAAKRQDQDRHEAVGNAIADVRRFEPSKKACGTLDELTDAWGLLRSVKSTDAEFADAQRAAERLEKCRLVWRNTLRQAADRLMVAQREAWAKRLDMLFLDNGLDVRISLSGRAKDRIQITWPLMSRVTVHQLNKSGDLVEGATKIGFKRITFADGFSESWYYELTPEGDEEAEKALAEQGLGEPMKL